MTVIIEPTDGNGQRKIDGVRLAVAMRFGGGGDWVVPNDMDVHATRDPELAAGPLNGFAYDSAGSSGLTAVIETGEAFVQGYIASDDKTVTDGSGNAIHEVDLSASTANQTVYLGYDHTKTDGLIIGLDSDFPSAQNPRIPIWEFDTDASSITSSKNLRPYGPENASSDLFYPQAVADQRFVKRAGGGLDADLNFKGHSAVNVVIDPRSSRPSDPYSLQAILRTDTDPYRFEVNTPNGWRVAKLQRVYPPIDDFEDGEFSSEYVKVGGGFSGTAAVTASAARSGQYGLELTDYTQLASMPGDGLPNYPSAGDSFRIHLNPQLLGNAEQYWTFFGRQSDADGADTYSVEFISGDASNENGIRVRKRQSGNTTTLASDFAITNYSSDRWYRIIVKWRTDGFDVELWDTAGSDQLITTITSTDTDYQSGGVGYRSSGGSQVYYDDIELVD